MPVAGLPKAQGPPPSVRAVCRLVRPGDKEPQIPGRARPGAHGELGLRIPARSARAQRRARASRHRWAGPSASAGVLGEAAAPTAGVAERPSHCTRRRFCSTRCIQGPVCKPQGAHSLVVTLQRERRLESQGRPALRPRGEWGGGANLPCFPESSQPLLQSHQRTLAAYLEICKNALLGQKDSPQRADLQSLPTQV